MSNHNPNAATLHDSSNSARVEASKSKWLHAGAVAPEGSTIWEIAKLAGTDFAVEKLPVTMPIKHNGEDVMMDVPNVYAMNKRRGDKILGPIPGVSVGERYTPLQNLDAFKIIDGLAGEGVVVPQASGLLREGATVWAFASLNKVSVHRQSGKEDVIENHLFFRTSHDGSSSFVLGLTPRNMTCDNMLTGIARNLTMEWRLQHTASAEEALSRATSIIPQMVHASMDLHQIFQTMADRSMTVDAFRDFANLFLQEYRGLITTKDELKLVAQKQKREQEIGELEHYFLNGLGNDGTSTWDAYQSITEWLDHQRDRVRKVTETSKHRQNGLATNVFGTGRKAKSVALKMLTK